MADTYSKLLGLSDATRQSREPENKAPEKLVITQAPEIKESKASLLANKQTGKLAKVHTSKIANQQTNKEANQQTNLPTNKHTSTTPLSTKEKKKYGTYLRPDSIIDVQVHAAQSHQKDHELLQEIVDLYFQNLKKQFASKLPSQQRSKLTKK